ncbi:MAG: class I SAM-dependent methyltransferase [Acidobacteria bacterium]|nr:MAG: class I SAM-dependent methyltransferase [Acidobacteriota bacterium]
MSQPTCRFCSAPLRRTFVDLGTSPLANAYRDPAAAAEPEVFYPLHTYLCDGCFLVQLPAVQSPEEIFRHYAYFSSYADTWLAHAEAYAAAMVERFHLGSDSRVVEVASNDGYLLRFFKERGIPVLGIEPAQNVARAAEAIGIPTITEFFGRSLAQELAAGGRRADLLVANNVLAHTPHLNDFVAGLALALAPGGVLTLEFPHLLELIEHNQFDTIYHEHFSYFSFTTAHRVLAAHHLEVFDVERLPTHGGSLRVYARHRDAGGESVSRRVTALLAEEEAAGYLTLDPYRGFAERVRATKRALLRFLIEAKDAGKRIAGYGAPAKGNTLLNYCGIRTDFLDFTVDRSPHKQGRLLPGSQVPIRPPDAIREARPDYVLILPWNLRQEIVEQMADVRDWGGRFVVAIPELEEIP